MSDLLPAWPLLSAFLVASFVLRVTPGRIFRDGFVVALLNPKTALFFAAMPVVTDTAYAFAAGAAASMLARARGTGAAGRYLTGGAFIGLGVFTALAGARGTK